MDNSSVEGKIDSSYSELGYFSTKPPSSNCKNIRMSPVCLLYDVAYRMYENAGRIESASEYRRDVYANTEKNC